MSDIAYAGHLLDYLARRADNAGARAWDSVMRDIVHTGKSGTARAWFTSHDGAQVRTLQATAHETGAVTGAWAPGARTVNASRAGSVRLDGSAREYAGLRVVASSAETLIAVTAWGDDAMQVCVYTTRAL